MEGEKKGWGYSGERGRAGKGVGVGLNNKSIQFCLLRFLLPSGNNTQLKTNGGRNCPQTILYPLRRKYVVQHRTRLLGPERDGTGQYTFIFEDFSHFQTKVNVNLFKQCNMSVSF